MANVVKTKDKIIVECDCGTVIHLTKDLEGNISSKSYYSKKDKEKENGPSKEKPDPGTPEPAKPERDWWD